MGVAHQMALEGGERSEGATRCCIVRGCAMERSAAGCSAAGYWPADRSADDCCAADHVASGRRAANCRAAVCPEGGGESAAGNLIAYPIKLLTPRHACRCACRWSACRHRIGRWSACRWSACRFHASHSRPGRSRVHHWRSSPTSFLSCSFSSSSAFASTTCPTSSRHRPYTNQCIPRRGHLHIAATRAVVAAEE